VPRNVSDTVIANAAIRILVGLLTPRRRINRLGVRAVDNSPRSIICILALLNITGSLILATPIAASTGFKRKTEAALVQPHEPSGTPSTPRRDG
jgi:hypothetical protein